jgi:hypothetical protein
VAKAIIYEVVMERLGKAVDEGGIKDGDVAKQASKERGGRNDAR